MSIQNTYLKRLVAAVVQESGICTPTVEVVLPAVFDVIRRELCECPHHCVMIESFGTFAMEEIPEREHLYTYKGVTTLKHLPATKRLKFSAAKNLRREVDAGVFDPSRKSFKHHPGDPVLRNRAQMAYRADRKDQLNKGATRFIKGHTGSTETTETTDDEQLSAISHQSSDSV